MNTFAASPIAGAQGAVVVEQRNRKQARDDRRSARDQVRDLAAMDLVGMWIERNIGHARRPQRKITLSLDALETGEDILVRGGEVSEITLSGLAGYSFQSAALTLANRTARMAAAPPGDTVWGEWETQAGHPGYQHAVWRLQPPLFVHRILAQAHGRADVRIEYADARYRPHPIFPQLRDGLFETTPGQALNSVEFILGPGAALTGRIALVTDNLPRTLSLSTAEDRILHRAPQLLRKGAVATTPDMAETLNSATGDALTLRLMSQTDCVLRVTGRTRRIRVATGFQTQPAPEIRLTPWTPLTLTPQSVGSSGGQTTDLSARARAVGPVHAGLMQSVGPGVQTLTAHKRLRYAQPFLPFAAQGARTMTLTGLWLLLDAPPDSEAALTATIAPWDARAEAEGAPVAEAAATFPTGLSAYEVGPAGRHARWIPFTSPWALDPDAQTRPHVLSLSEFNGPAHILEAPLAHPRLFPALSRDAGRRASLSRRGFGGADKGLLFELGVAADATAVQASSGMGVVGVSVAQAEAALSARLPHGALTLTANGAVVLSDLAATTTTPPEG